MDRSIGGVATPVPPEQESAQQVLLQALDRLAACEAILDGMSGADSQPAPTAQYGLSEAAMVLRTMAEHLEARLETLQARLGYLG